MNTQETTNEKPLAAKGTAKKTTAELYFENLHGDGKLTRVPVAHLYAPPGEYFDHSGGGSQSQLSNCVCVRPAPALQRGSWVCDFIPAWQVFELSFVPGPDSTPVTELVPVAHVKRWKRA